VCFFRNQTGEAQMRYYIGLGVSQRQTAICVVDEPGEIVAESKVLTAPDDIYRWLETKGIPLKSIVTMGVEAGAMSAWLCTELIKRDLPMVCLESHQAHRFLKTCRNKTDKNDARGLAQLVRIGGAAVQSVRVRAQVSQQARMLLTLRQHLVHQRICLENHISGSLKPFGLVIPRGGVCVTTFTGRVATALIKADELNLKLREGVMPLLDLYENLCKQLDLLTAQVEAIAKQHPVCRRLMTAPGVGPIIALSYVTAVDQPERFARNADIGAYFGLTPRQYQSGEMDHQGGISRLGSSMTRQHLVQAATVLLSHTKRWSALKAWGMKVAKKRGFNKARIAVARKLAVILHRMWMNNENFRWSSKVEQECAGQHAPAQSILPA
jgi:transposase